MGCMNCIVEGSCFRVHQSGYSSLSALGGLSQLLLPCTSPAAPCALLMTHCAYASLLKGSRGKERYRAPVMFSVLQWGVPSPWKMF